MNLKIKQNLYTWKKYLICYKCFINENMKFRELILNKFIDYTEMNSYVTDL